MSIEQNTQERVRPDAVPKRRAGRPRKDEADLRPVAVRFPEGMSDPLLTWACGFSTRYNPVQRWRTGEFPVPAIARIMAGLWEDLEPREFIRVMTDIRGEPPPEPRVNIDDIIVDIMKTIGEPMSRHDISDAMSDLFGRDSSLNSVGTTLSRLKRDGRASQADKGLWVVARKEAEKVEATEKTEKKTT
jgi:hypothetical protein